MMPHRLVYQFATAPNRVAAQRERRVRNRFRAAPRCQRDVMETRGRRRRLTPRSGKLRRSRGAVAPVAMAHKLRDDAPMFPIAPAHGLGG